MHGGRSERRERRRVAVRRRRAAALGVLAILGATVAWAATGPSSGGGAPSTRTGARTTVAAGAKARARVTTAARTVARITPARPGIAHVVTEGPAAKVAALTFDDGYCDACVGSLVAAVARTGAHVTFCPNGTYGRVWEHHAAAIRRLIARGQAAICNHTFSHSDLRQLGKAAVRQEIVRNEMWIERTFGVTARPFLRPPYGAYDATVVAVAGSLGYTRVVMWSGTLADSSPRAVDYVVAAVRKWARPGVIILGHGNYPATGAGFARMLAVLRAKGLRTVTLPELFATTQ